MKTKNKMGYIPPKCKVIKMETENFICTSITPNVQLSGEQNWEDGGGHSGGDMYIGEYGSVAP